MKKKSWFYSIIGKYVALMLRIYYKKIVAENIENIPKDEAFIFAPNHQNALMDPLVVIYTSKTQPYFLARADIFKRSFISAILNKLRIRPVYRIRDGKDSLKKNKDVFKDSIKILKSGIPLGLFPETTHNNKRAMLPIKKGVQKIAFQAEEENDFELGLKILPVGICYSNYENFRTVVYVRFGTPFTVTEFKDIYLENQQKALLKFRDKIAESLRPLMIDIQNNEYYQTYENSMEICNSSIREKLNLQINNQLSKFTADKKIIELLDIYYEKSPENFKVYSKKVQEYSKILKVLNLRDWLVEKRIFSFSEISLEIISLILLLPINIFGILFNYLPYKIPMLAIKNVKDHQFHSSIKFVVGLIIFPIFYLIYWIVFFFTTNFNISLFLIICLPFSGILAFSSYIKAIKLSSKFKFYNLYRKSDKKLFRSIWLREEIIRKMEDIYMSNQ